MIPEETLGRRDTLRARNYAYYWLGRLLREGVTSETEGVVRQLPELAPLLPVPFDADGAAADHQALFGFNLFPYEGVFLDPSAQLGGPATDSVLRSYGRLGYRSPPGGGSGDHFGSQLDALAYLGAGELDALEDGLSAEATRISALTRGFLDDHLLRWLAPLQAAMAACGLPLYVRLSALAVDLLLSHRQALGPLPELPPLPESPELLAGERVRLRDIAGYLLRPVHSGVYLSRDDIAGLARTLRLPRGFGSREQLLVNLLRSAAQYDSAAAVFSRLIAYFDARRADYAAQAASWPALAAVWQPWASRSAATREILGAMEAEVAALATEE